MSYAQPLLVKAVRPVGWGVGLMLRDKGNMGLKVGNHTTAMTGSFILQSVLWSNDENFLPVETDAIYIFVFSQFTIRSTPPPKMAQAKASKMQQHKADLDL